VRFFFFVYKCAIFRFLILPVGTETEFSFIYEDEWKHTGFPISPRIPFDDQASPSSIENYLLWPPQISHAVRACKNRDPFSRIRATKLDKFGLKIL
jgi:hypothetical protein